MQETYHGEVEREQATQAYEGAAAPAQAVGDLIPDSQSGPPQQASRQHFMVGRSRVMSCVCQRFGRPFESSGCPNHCEGERILRFLVRISCRIWKLLCTLYCVMWNSETESGGKNPSMTVAKCVHHEATSGKCS